MKTTLDKIKLRLTSGVLSLDEPLHGPVDACSDTCRSRSNLLLGECSDLGLEGVEHGLQFISVNSS